MLKQADTAFCCHFFEGYNTNWDRIIDFRFIDGLVLKMFQTDCRILLFAAVKDLGRLMLRSGGKRTGKGYKLNIFE